MGADRQRPVQQCRHRLLPALTAVLLWTSVAFGQTDTLAAAAGEIAITPMVHASVQLRYGDLVIQVDPWSAANPERYEAADLILITDTPGRMTPDDAAECARAIAPEIVYTYHYDQGYARRLPDPGFAGPELPGGLNVAQSLERFADALAGSGIEYRRRDWYPLP